MSNFEQIGMVLCLLISAVFTAHAEAADNSAKETVQEMIDTATKKENNPWNIDINQTWLPDSGIRGTGGKASMGEVEIIFGRSYQINSRLSLSTGLAYSLREIDAPTNARLPEKLHTISINMGGNYQIKDNLFLDVTVSPGLNGDFKKIGADDIRTQIGFMGRYNMSEKLTLLAGLVYQQGFESFPVVPILGAIYRPNEQWTISLAAPRPGVTYSPDKKSSYYIGGEFTGGEYQLHDPSLGAKIIEYSDFRALAGVEYTLFSAIKVGIAGGYAFGREFVFHDGPRSDVKIDNNAFVRFSAGMAW